MGFNLTYHADPAQRFGTINTELTPGKNGRFRQISVNGRRTMFPYDLTLHSERCLFFPGDYRDEYRLGLPPVSS
jgi:hypothetical protein